MSNYTVLSAFGSKAPGDKITAAEFNETEIAYLLQVGLIESDIDASEAAPRAKKVSTKSED